MFVAIFHELFRWEIIFRDEADSVACTAVSLYLVILVFRVTKHRFMAIFETYNGVRVSYGNCNPFN